MFLSNHVTNLSKGGLFIETPSPLPLQSEVLLKLTLPDVGAIMETKGRVIWTYDVKKGTARVVPGMGIKLVETSPEHRQQLEGYLAGLEQKARGVARGEPTQSRDAAPD